jgi:hypothetical protein
MTPGTISLNFQMFRFTLARMQMACRTALK